MKSNAKKVQSIYDRLKAIGYTSISVDDIVDYNARHINITSLDSIEDSVMITFGDFDKTSKIINRSIEEYVEACSKMYTYKELPMYILLPQESSLRNLVNREKLIRATNLGGAIYHDPEYSDNVISYLTWSFPVSMSKVVEVPEIFAHYDQFVCLDYLLSGKASMYIGEDDYPIPIHCILNNLVTYNKTSILKSFEVILKSKCIIFPIDDFDSILEFVRNNIEEL
ncbi:MAG: hypothetical protein ACRCX2_38965 [Paraclostridium sp.]